MTRRVIIDTDPGHDDAFALLLALASPDEIELLGITTVAGNVSVDKTTSNALRVLELAGMAQRVPVYRGCARPMAKSLVTAEYVHGKSGLDGPDLPEPTTAHTGRHAVDYLVETLSEAGERAVTVCLLGPMTNMGTALAKEPAIAGNIAEFAIMGGGFDEGGNITPAAEFNIYVDPDAADIVLTSGVPTTIMPLDVTHQARATPDRAARFREMGSGVGDALYAMLEYSGRYGITEYGIAGYPLHDPTVIAYLIDPGLFSLRPAHVAVVTGDGPTEGQTIADWTEQSGDETNAVVAMGIDSDRFFDLLTDRISRL